MTSCACPAAVPVNVEAGAKVTESRHYYPLDAPLLEPLRQQLAERALAAGLVGGAIGRTRQDVQIGYRLEPLATGCRLTGLGGGPDCVALGKLAQREVFRVKLRFELREKAYDEPTGHGVFQGSVL